MGSWKYTAGVAEKPKRQQQKKKISATNVLLNSVLEEKTLWTHSERKVGSDGDFGAQVNVAMGVADGKHSVSRRQRLGFHPAAVVLARSQPLCVGTKTKWKGPKH